MVEVLGCVNNWVLLVFVLVLLSNVMCDVLRQHFHNTTDSCLTCQCLLFDLLIGVDVMSE